MLRKLWYPIGLFFLTAWYGTKAVVFGLLGIPNRQGGVYDRIGRTWSAKVLKVAGVAVRTQGMDRVPRDQPVVFVSNHQSFFDILALSATLPGTMRFVAKKELAKVPIFGKAMRSAGHIFIDRQNRAKAFDAYEEAAQAVREGMCAVVFAEGTRSRTGNLLPFKKGPFVFAIASQVPLVPIYCAGTFDILPKGSIWVRPKPVTLMFGEPISTKGLVYEDREQLMARTRAVIERLRFEAGE
ncbi:MAG: 1-acyl-sn-glycerol-3-phosphate acyltransferase [Gemmatimonadota bacterium]|nr:MAG: 1-acyl-sn-glycerol-3-phosphate acyltransferase [Gemmatimonadota bacterium]